MSYYVLVVFFCGASILNVQFCPGSRRKRLLCTRRHPKMYQVYGYITHHGLYCSHAKYHYINLGHTVVMKIWIIDSRQSQGYRTWAELCYFMSVSTKLSYLLDSIMLLSQGRVTNHMQYSLSNSKWIRSCSPQQRVLNVNLVETRTKLHRWIML